MRIAKSLHPGTRFEPLIFKGAIIPHFCEVLRSSRFPAESPMDPKNHAKCISSGFIPGRTAVPLALLRSYPLNSCFCKCASRANPYGFCKSASSALPSIFSIRQYSSCDSGTLQAVSGSGFARLFRTALLGDFPNPEDRTLRGYAFFSKC